MYLAAALLVNFIIASYVPSAKTEETFYYRPISEQNAVERLDVIEPSQVLPLVQHLRFPIMHYLPPRSLDKVIIDKGRIINGTQFDSENRVQEYFFCPKENSDKYCLVSKEFQGLQPLECAKEPTLVVEKRENISCGMLAIGRSYGVFYKICPMQETDQSDNTKTREVLLYEICYNEEKKKTIFTNHFIGYPELLESKILRREHSLKYNIEITPGMSSSDILMDPLIEEFEAQNYKKDRQQIKHIYRTQKFIPTEDFAFALWRKSTYRDLNIEYQHEALMPLWEEINNSIRNQAKKMYAAEGIEFSVHTGVFELASVHRTDGQKPNVWAKLIYAFTQDDVEPKFGVVILMNNFIINEVELATSSKPKGKLIINYCEDDFCEETLNTNFKSIGGRVRCCSVNEEFKQLFYLQDYKTNLQSSHQRNVSHNEKFPYEELVEGEDDEPDSPTPIARHIKLLRIPGINNDPDEKDSSTIYVQSTETKGTLYYEAIGEQEAVDSLVAIQSEQILPLVQLLNNINMSLASPTGLEKVFIDQGRIINGTKFNSDYETEQVLLCTDPNVKNNAYCLVPKKFRGLEPLECGEPHLYTKELENVSCGANGVGKSSILYYQICDIRGPTKKMKIIEVCYDQINSRTIFTRHFIGYPELLDSKALSREHSVEFEMKPVRELPIQNTLELMAAHALEANNSDNTEIQPANRSDQKLNYKYHNYKLQKFTPPEDLAFGLFRKIAYGYFNVEFQREMLIPLWNEMNELIRNQAKKMYENERVRFAVHTGVVNESHIPVEKYEDQPNVWAKLIYAKASNVQNPISGLVILVQNYIYLEPPSITTSESSDQSVLNYCKNDVCESTLKTKFKNAGSLVRCCSVSEELKTMFWWHDNFDSKSPSDVSIPILHIPGVTEFVENPSRDVHRK